MMGQWGNGDMMGFGGFAGFSFWGTIFVLVVLADLILLGIWLWKQIQRK
ncbi:MAG: hypothetical protein UV41_C0011G0017 [Candidatus Daviesbacteria bacterium GW2011_GWA2_42_7]|uniref:Uncharacterized protein n=1 Tax=Candidatus Daviesbacteria bacterium GW2011_GWA2_42_7 TaxID=1618425 RepID=A0A0G1BBV2_9BACT|nr:MAG: hypothetical protein UV41_C0011G0017 [Candidatus Daviesbacteria bacterium GW2011_GWA2_42_7]